MPIAKNAIDGVPVGVRKIGTRPDEDVEASEPRDFPLVRNEVGFTQYVEIDIRPIEECPNLRFEHCKLLEFQKSLFNISHQFPCS